MIPAVYGALAIPIILIHLMVLSGWRWFWIGPVYTVAGFWLLMVPPVELVVRPGGELLTLLWCIGFLPAWFGKARF